MNTQPPKAPNKKLDKAGAIKFRRRFFQSMNAARQLSKEGFCEAPPEEIDAYEKAVSQIPMVGRTVGEIRKDMKACGDKHLTPATTNTPIKKTMITTEPKTTDTFINFKSHAVLIQTHTGNVCQLQRLGSDRWGFVFLTSPTRSPVAQAETASAAVAVARHLEFEIHVAELKEIGEMLKSKFPKD